MYISLICVYAAVVLCTDEVSEGDSSGIHLNIEYPSEEQSKLDLETGEKEEQLERKTPVVIISPKPLVDYERLYKKMMELKPNVKGKPSLENDVVYDEKVASSDPVYRREILYNLLKDVESRIAFYRADENEVELIMSSNAGWR